jgi:hypothetical protein
MLAEARVRVITFLAAELSRAASAFCLDPRTVFRHDYPLSVRLIAGDLANFEEEGHGEPAHPAEKP